MQKQLVLTEETAIKLFPSASTEFKETLIETFGKKIFYKNVIERLFNMEDACNDQGIDYKRVYEGIDDPIDQAEKAIKIFAKAMREGKHESECFFYPYFDRSGGGFSYDDCDYVFDYSYVGARLRVDTAEKAKHLGQCMLSSYRLMLTGK